MTPFSIIFSQQLFIFGIVVIVALVEIVGGLVPYSKHVSSGPSTIKVLALGRDAHLGSIYNPLTESFIGKSLFQFNTPLREYLDSHHPSLIHVRSTLSSSTEFKILTKLQDKYDLASVPLSPMVTFLSGQPQLLQSISGSAKFLLDEPQTSTDHLLVASLLQKIKTVEETLDVTRNQNLEDLDHFADWTAISNKVNVNVSGLYIVTGIEWGTQVAANVFQLTRNSQKKSVHTMRNELSTKLYQMAFEPVHRHKTNEGHGLTPDHSSASSNYTIRIFSDLEFDHEFIAPTNTNTSSNSTLTLTFDQVEKLLRKTSEVIQRRNGGKGVPIAFSLSPLQDIIDLIKRKPIKKTGQVKGHLEIESAILQKIVELFEDTHKLKNSIADLKREMRTSGGAECLHTYIGHDIDRLSHNLNEAVTRFQTQIRSSKENPSKRGLLEESLWEFSDSLRSVRQSFNSDLFRNARKKLDVFKLFQRNPRVTYVGRGRDLFTIIKDVSHQSHKPDGDKIVYVFYYKPEAERATDKTSKSLWTKNVELFMSTLDKNWNSLFVADCDFQRAACAGIDTTTVHQYCRGLLTSTDCLKRMSVKIKASQRISQLALGRNSVKVGDLFDSRVEAFTGSSIFQTQQNQLVSNSSQIHFENYPEDRRTFVTIPGHSFEEKFKALKIKDRDLQLALLSGLVPLENSGLFFSKDQCLTSEEQNQLLRSTMFTVTTGRSFLDWSAPNFSRALNISRLTDPDLDWPFSHFVKEIQYGHNTFISLLTSNPNYKKPGDATTREFWDTMLDHDLENLKGALGQFPNNSHYVDQLSFSSSEFAVFSDILPEKFQRLKNIREIFDRLSQSRELLGNEDHFGRPVSFVLEPIESLQKPFGIVTPNREYRRFTTSKDDEVTQRSIKVFETIARTERDFKDLVELMHGGSKCSTQIAEQWTGRLHSLDMEFRRNVTHFREDFETKLIAVKSARAKPSELGTLVQDFLQNGQFTPDLKLGALDQFSKSKEQIEKCLRDYENTK